MNEKEGESTSWERSWRMRCLLKEKRERHWNFRKYLEFFRVPDSSLSAWEPAEDLPLWWPLTIRKWSCVVRLKVLMGNWQITNFHQLVRWWPRENVLVMLVPGPDTWIWQAWTVSVLIYYFKTALDSRECGTWQSYITEIRYWIIYHFRKKYQKHRWKHF